MREIEAWFGLTAVEDGSREAVVLGCPFEGAHSLRGGAGDGPAAIREWSTTAEAVTEGGDPVEGLRVTDLGDLDIEAGPDSGAGSGADPGDRWQAIETGAREAWDAHPGAFLLALGGDHSITPPLAAVARERHEDLAFVLLDAHPDAFDTYDGDPLSHACVLPRLWDRCGFSPDDTCVLGVRSYAYEELDALGRCARVVEARRWHRKNSTWLAEELVAATRGRPVYLSLDIDVLDPSCAPGTGYPVAGGPTTRDLLKLLEEIWERQPVVAMDLVEVAPALDSKEVTVATTAHVCLQVLGHVARARWSRAR